LVTGVKGRWADTNIVEVRAGLRSNPALMEELDLGQTIRGFAVGQKVFARYVLRAIVGRGGMGIVWRAFDEHLERDVALKFLPELIIHDRAVLDDLKRETKRNLDLTHHNIVRIYDFAQDSSSACISMEFVDGETLSALRVDRPDKVFQADELTQPMAELCEALTYAHTRASIVHRDLKPTNLMLTSKGILKVTDFGIARSLSDSISMLTMARGVSGTLLYMSPQQLDGDRASPADDIYSVGATIYELLTSKPPFYSGGVERQIHDKAPPPMSVRREDLGIVSSVAIPQHWEDCVAACLAKDPALRPPTAAALAERLRGILPVTPPVSLQPLAPSRPEVILPAVTQVPANEVDPPQRSKRLLYIIATTTAVLLLGAAALFFSSPSRNHPAAPPPQTVTWSPTSTTPVPTPAATITRTSPSVVATTPVSTPVVTAIPTQPSVLDTAISSPSAPPSAAVSPVTTRSAPYSSSDGYGPATVTVDMNRIFKEYNKTKDSEKKINEAKGAAKKEYDERAENYKKALDEINKLNQQVDAPSLSATAKTEKAKQRDEKIADIKIMEKEITEFRQTREKQLQEQALRMRTGIVSDITNEITKLNTSSKGLIYDKSGNSLNGVPVVVSSRDSADVSNDVIAALNGKRGSSFRGIQDVTVGVVDMNRIFKAYNKTKDSEKKINEAKAAAKKEYDDRADSYKKALGAVKTEADRTNVKNMEREMNEFRQTRERQLQEQAARMRDNIVKEIMDVVFEGMKATNTDLILDVSGQSMNSVPFLAYLSGVPDFSEDVITALNGGNRAVRFHAAGVPSKKLRFGVVDMNRAFKMWPETVSAEAKINTDKEAAKKEYDRRADNYKKALEEINKLNVRLDSPSLSASDKTSLAKERDEKIAQIKNTESEINEFKTTRERQLQEQAMKMREGIVAKITAALKSQAAKESFNLVFDSSGQSMQGVLVTVLTPGIPDLTDKVLGK
jgi:serine/threonine protein kinase/Skp family chaperone for outer membrane proteins